MTTNDPFLDLILRLVTPFIDGADAELYDLERSGNTIRITIDRRGGIDLDVLATINRSLSRALDETETSDEAYVLEVSSPGLERTLRTSAHWERSVGERVKVKTRRDVDGSRRFDGIVVGIAESVALMTVGDVNVALPLDVVDRARTVFEWGPTPKPGGKKATSSSTPTLTTASTGQPDSEAEVSTVAYQTPPNPATPHSQETQEASQ